MGVQVVCACRVPVMVGEHLLCYKGLACHYQNTALTGEIEHTGGAIIMTAQSAATQHTQAHHKHSAGAPPAVA